MEIGLGIFGIIFVFLIYVVGCITAYHKMTTKMESGEIDLVYYMIFAIFCVFSWLMILAMFIGETLKAIPKNNDDFLNHEE